MNMTQSLLLHCSLFAFGAVYSYILFGGIFYYIWYYKQKGKEKEWKCQPDKFLTNYQFYHQVFLGSFNMMMAGIGSGFITFKVRNVPNFTKLYFDYSEYGLFYLIFSFILVWIYLDAMAYYAHRFWHHKSLYKYIHKWHHYYKYPTAYTIVAMHPIEFIIYFSIVVSPIFLIPFYYFNFFLILIYLYYYGLVDHSGIILESIFPWQPNSIFHDDHHQYFHCNYGQNMSLWDHIHGSVRNNKKEYSEIKYNKNNECSLL